MLLQALPAIRGDIDHEIILYYSILLVHMYTYVVSVWIKMTYALAVKQLSE